MPQVQFSLSKKAGAHGLLKLYLKIFHTGLEESIILFRRVITGENGGRNPVPLLDDAFQKIENFIINVHLLHIDRRELPGKVCSNNAHLGGSYVVLKVVPHLFQRVFIDYRLSMIDTSNL